MQSTRGSITATLNGRYVDILYLAILFLAALPGTSRAHGGVVAENDQCIINIGYLTAHFRIYVPEVKGHQQYCEDIPVRGESVFVMEYLHEGLGTMPVAFRIIHNTTGKGNYARLEDVLALPDLDAVTVHYEPPATVRDVYLLLHDFADEGEYIGIVTAGGTGPARRHSAVFPFAVGGTGTGVWPWIIAALVALQFQFWYWRRRSPVAAATGALLIALACPAPAQAVEGTVQSEHGHFSLSYSSSLEPLAVNRMHSWLLVLEDSDGNPVDGVDIRVEGGMPAHDHGLATTPRAVPCGVAGHYRIEGLRFHMPGEWELMLTISGAENPDRVLLRFRV